MENETSYTYLSAYHSFWASFMIHESTLKSYRDDDHYSPQLSCFLHALTISKKKSMLKPPTTKISAHNALHLHNHHHKSHWIF